MNLLAFCSHFVLHIEISFFPPFLGTFNYSLVSPTITSANDFVKALELYTNNHQAVTHHLLENISCASFGTKETANIILLFLSAYSKFNSGFVERIQKLIYLLDDGKEREVLRESKSKQFNSQYRNICEKQDTLFTNLRYVHVACLRLHYIRCEGRNGILR